jgi:hypothetical protein
MSDKELEKFSEDEISFEKFTKQKKFKDLDRKKSLRDFRVGKDKRDFTRDKEKGKNDAK